MTLTLLGLAWMVAGSVAWRRAVRRRRHEAQIKPIRSRYEQSKEIL